MRNSLRSCAGLHNVSVWSSSFSISPRIAQGYLESSQTSKRGFSGDFDEFSGVAPLPSYAAETDPVEDHHQVRRLDLDMAGRLGRRGREPEASSLQPLVPQDISIGIPIEDLDAIAAPAAENGSVRWALPLILGGLFLVDGHHIHVRLRFQVGPSVSVSLVEPRTRPSTSSRHLCPFGEPHLFAGRIDSDDGTTGVPITEMRPWRGLDSRRRAGPP
jgi:hypothetical protein